MLFWTKKETTRIFLYLMHTNNNTSFINNIINNTNIKHPLIFCAEPYSKKTPISKKISVYTALYRNKATNEYWHQYQKTNFVKGEARIRRELS